MLFLPLLPTERMNRFCDNLNRFWRVKISAAFYFQHIVLGHIGKAVKNPDGNLLSRFNAGDIRPPVYLKKRGHD